MEHVYHIKYEYKENGKSLREIARETGHSRTTVKKYVMMEDFNQEPPIKRRREGKTYKYRDIVMNWLISDEEVPRKQRHTAHRVYTRLLEEAEKKGQKLDVSERSIRNLVADLRKELQQKEEVSLPLLHPAGESQTDFGETEFVEGGVRYSGFHLCITFPHSDAKFTQLFKGQNFECLAEGMINIFEFIGGVPTNSRFDNLSPVVKAIKAWGEREVTDNFRRLQCHYGFESNFCNPAAGHEKGSVENYVGYSRRNYFVPVPHFEDLAEYNKELLQRCFADLDREHYKKEQTVRSLFEEDLAAMSPLPSVPFEGVSYQLVKTDQYGMCKFQSNRYSTSGYLRSCEVFLKASANYVTILDDESKPIVRHKRLYGKNKESMIWGPYLQVLAKRPNALCYSGFFNDLPDPLKDFLAKEDLHGKKRVLQVLAKNSDDKPLDVVISTMAQATKMDPRDVDDLISGFDYLMNKPGPIPKNDVPEGLPESPEYRIDLGAYARLLGGDRCNKK